MTTNNDNPRITPELLTLASLLALEHAAAESDCGHSATEHAGLVWWWLSVEEWGKAAEEVTEGWRSLEG